MAFNSLSAFLPKLLLSPSGSPAAVQAAGKFVVPLALGLLGAIRFRMFEKSALLSDRAFVPGVRRGRLDASQCLQLAHLGPSGRPRRCSLLGLTRKETAGKANDRF